MSHETLRLLSSLYNTPHLTTPEQFEIVEEYLEKRNLGIEDNEEDDEDEEEDDVGVEDGIGFLSISGPLTYRPVRTLCGNGGTNYQSLYEQTNRLIEAGASTIVLEINSGGGEAYNCFSYATKVRQLATDNNVKLIAYVDKLAASAAYAWAAIADEIVVNPQAEVGSIGVVVSLMDTSKAMEQEGYKRVFITAGGQKVPFDEGGGFKKEFISDLQEKVDILYEQFVDHVSTNLGVDEQLIRKTNAKTYLPEKAMEFGLVDKVMTDFEFADYLQSLSVKEEQTLIKKLFNMGGKKDKAELSAATQEEDMQLAELQAQFEAYKAEQESVIATLKQDYDAALVAAVAKAQEAEAALEKLTADVETKRLQARKDAIVEAVGTTKADAMFEATKALDDAAFATVLSGFKAAVDVQAEANPLMKEVGVDAQVEPTAEANDVAEVLRRKYQSK